MKNVRIRSAKNTGSGFHEILDPGSKKFRIRISKNFGSELRNILDIIYTTCAWLMETVRIRTAKNTGSGFKKKLNPVFKRFRIRISKIFGSGCHKILDPELKNSRSGSLKIPDPDFNQSETGINIKPVLRNKICNPPNDIKYVTGAWLLEAVQNFRITSSWTNQSTCTLGMIPSTPYHIVPSTFSCISLYLNKHLCYYPLIVPIVLDSDPEVAVEVRNPDSEEARDSEQGTDGMDMDEEEAEYAVVFDQEEAEKLLENVDGGEDSGEEGEKEKGGTERRDRQGEAREEEHMDLEDQLERDRIREARMRRKMEERRLRQEARDIPDRREEEARIHAAAMKEAEVEREKEAEQRKYIEAEARKMADAMYQRRMLKGKAPLTRPRTMAEVGLEQQIATARSEAEKRRRDSSESRPGSKSGSVADSKIGTVTGASQLNLPPGYRAVRSAKLSSLALRPLSGDSAKPFKPIGDFVNEFELNKLAHLSTMLHFGISAAVLICHPSSAKAAHIRASTVFSARKPRVMTVRTMHPPALS